VTDLERFFDRLVRNLVATDPSRLAGPISVTDIKTSLLPYRTNRRSLGLESAEEYEELLVRLVAGESELVITTPPEVAEWCQRQMASLTPDLSGIPGQAGASVAINPDALARILGPDAAAGVAKAVKGGEAMDGDLPLPPERCPHCDSMLPGSRAINFCPACGRNVMVVPCDQCGADMEPGWRFCVSCGQEVSDTTAAT